MKKLFLLFKPLIHRIATFYDIKVVPRCLPTGQNPIFIKGDPSSIPKSVVFNTRSGSITVGNNCVFGEDVMLLTGMHMGIEEATKAQKPLHHVPETGRDIIIGDNCYIGSRAILIGPLKIGDYAMIGAGAIVTKDVPPNVFVASPAAKIIKEFIIPQGNFK